MEYSATFARLIKPLKAIFAHWGLLAGALLIVVLGVSPIIQTLEESSSLAALFKWRGYRDAPKNIAIVALNARAHRNLNLPQPRKVWPRTAIADLVREISSRNARLIVLDIAFKDPRDEIGDLALAEAIAQAGNVVLFSYQQREQIALAEGLVDIEQMVPPLAQFAESSLGYGGFVLPKQQRIFFTSLQRFPAGVEPQPLLVARLYDPAIDMNIAQAERYYINFYGPPLTFRALNADQILIAKHTQQEDFSDAIVYLGYLETAQTEQLDAYQTVFTNQYGVDLSGVEISATVTANLLDNSGIRPLNTKAKLVLFVLILVFLSLVAMVMPKHLWLYSLLLVAVAWLTGGYLFNKHFIWLPLTTLSLLTVAFNIFWFGLQHTRQKQHLTRVSNALSHHLPPHAAAKLSRTLVNLEQEHELVSGVCLVTDIKGYTALAERMPPEKLHEIMNRYYALLVAAVKQHRGFVGNIVGDSLLALWTGPSVTTQMCQQALETVVSIQKSLREDEQLAQQLPTCSALHAGDFSLGHLGAKGHFEYSPVGDMINTATRVEHFNRDLNTEFLCTAPVAEKLNRLDQSTRLIYLGDFNLRNRKQASALFGVCVNDTTSEQFARALDYWQRQQPEALQLFKTLYENTGFGPAKYYLQMLQANSNHAN